MNWDRFFMDIARVYASKSKDPSTQVGAVIVGPHHEQRSGGYNGMARGLNDRIPERYVRPDKYLWIEHAERNAIYNAARVGIATGGCTLYIAAPLPPCANCARAIIQAGIVEVVCEDVHGHMKPENERWRPDMFIAAAMLAEAKIAFRNWRPD
jgi:dCMP deaminase